MDAEHLGSGNRMCSVVFADIVEYSQKLVSQQVTLKTRFSAFLAAALAHTASADRLVVDTGDGAALCFLGDPEDALFTANGFGWKLHDIIGAQVVSVPMAVPLRNAERAFYAFMGSLGAVFVLVFVVLNVMLSRMIIQPVSHMAVAAEQISTGNFDTPEFAERGRDEIAVLGRAFNRMRRSLQKALEMIDG